VLPRDLECGLISDRTIGVYTQEMPRAVFQLMTRAVALDVHVKRPQDGALRWNRVSFRAHLLVGL
jgi:hypothetical protein